MSATYPLLKTRDDIVWLQSSAELERRNVVRAAMVTCCPMVESGLAWRNGLLISCSRRGSNVLRKSEIAPAVHAAPTCWRRGLLSRADSPIGP
jgi:hypothetical protein